jgi:hypothetical protein
MRRADPAEALLDTADHHVADHLAGDAGGGGDPTDRFTVVAVEGEATRTTSPFQQVNSSASEHQQQFERIVATWPSCSRARRRPVWRWSSSPCFFISR